MEWTVLLALYSVRKGQEVVRIWAEMTNERIRVEAQTESSLTYNSSCTGIDSTTQGQEKSGLLSVSVSSERSDNSGTAYDLRR